MAQSAWLNSGYYHDFSGESCKGYQQGVKKFYSIEWAGLAWDLLGPCLLAVLKIWH